jgi:hypothetical protein
VELLPLGDTGSVPGERYERVRPHLVEALSRAASRAAGDAWPILQGTVAATLAWVIAKHVFGHQEPFFAPVAAIIGLNATVGERGLHAVRLLQGVFVGIVVGELTLAALGAGYGALGLGIFVAVMIARALGGARIVLAQAAVGAILVITVGTAEAGLQRLLDALIGVSVALVFTQLLFSPEPISLLRRAEAAALADMANGLGVTADALERGDEAMAERALNSLRELRDRLAELARARRASVRAARHSLVWRSRAGPAVQESENAGHIDLLGGSCVLLTRTATATTMPGRLKLAPTVRALAEALSNLSQDPGDQDTRQRAADRALAVARPLAGSADPREPFLSAAILAARMVAADIMLFAGVDSEDVLDAVRDGTAELAVPKPPSARRTPFA